MATKKEKKEKDIPTTFIFKTLAFVAFVIVVGLLASGYFWGNPADDTKATVDPGQLTKVDPASLDTNAWWPASFVVSAIGVGALVFNINRGRGGAGWTVFTIAEIIAFFLSLGTNWVWLHVIVLIFISLAAIVNYSYTPKGKQLEREFVKIPRVTRLQQRALRFQQKHLGRRGKL